METPMNTRRIFLSSLMLLAVTGVLVGGTGAFFTDTEQSTGNVFTAGSIDLMVDHAAQSYNGEDCTSRCDRYAKEVVSFNQGPTLGGSPVTASRSSSTMALGAPNTPGTDFDGSQVNGGFVSLGFGGSTTLRFPNGIDDGPGDDIRIYEATGGNSYPTESVKVEVSVDGIDWTTITVDPQEIDYDGTVEIDLSGQAPLVYYVRITDTTDPADHAGSPEADGYDLDAVEALHCDDEETDGVESDIWQCQLWEATDLTTETFFNFVDLKPQDTGNNLISLHVDDNDAYACLAVANQEDEENTNVSPEQDAGDTSTPEGEIGEYLMVAGYYSDAAGTKLGEMFPPTPIEDLERITYADSSVGTPIAGGSTAYVKLEWCLGSLGSDGTCDGDVNGINTTQTDSFMADLQFEAIQTRNNDEFLCDTSVVAAPN